MKLQLLKKLVCTVVEASAGLFAIKTKKQVRFYYVLEARVIYSACVSLFKLQLSIYFYFFTPGWGQGCLGWFQHQRGKAVGRAWRRRGSGGRRGNMEHGDAYERREMRE